MPSAEQLQTLLYVDDEPLLREVVKAGLEDAGFSVLLAPTADAAEALILKNKDGIVGLITDINLGGPVDGWELARRVRTAHPTLPIVYVSGKEGESWSAQGVPNSVMVPKPFVQAQIVVAVSGLLNVGSPPG